MTKHVCTGIGMLDATQLASALFASSEEKKAQSKLSSSQITPDGDKISGSSIGADRPFQNDMGTEAPRNTHPDADTGRSNSNDPVCSGDRSTRIGIQGNNNNSAPLSANAVTSAATTTAAILAQMAIESGAISNGGDSIYGGGGQSTKAGNTGEVGDGIQWSINVSPLHSLTSKTRRLEQEHARSMLKKGKEKEREIEKERRESWGKSSFSMKHNIMVVGATHGNASTSPVIETSNNDSNRKTHSRRNEGHKTKVKSGSRQKLHHRHSHFKEHIASPAQRAQLKSSISILKERFSELDIDDSGRIDFPGFVFGILSWVGMSDGDEANNNDADGEGSGGLPITAFTNRARENNGEVIGFDRGGNHGKAARNVPDLKKQGCVEESIPLAARGEVAGGDGKSSVGAGTCVSAKNVVQKQAWGGGSPSSNALGATKAKTLASLTTSSLSFKPEIGPSGIANIRPTAIASNRRAIVSGDDNNRRNAQPAYRSSTTRTIVNVKNAEVRVKGRGVGAGSPLHFNPLDEPSFLRRFTEERQL